MNKQEAQFVSLVKAFSTVAIPEELKPPHRLWKIYIESGHHNILKAARRLAGSCETPSPEVIDLFKLITDVKNPVVLIPILKSHFEKLGAEVTEKKFIEGLVVLYQQENELSGPIQYRVMKAYAIELVTSDHRTTLDPRTVDAIKLILDGLSLPDFKEKILAVLPDLLAVKERTEIAESNDMLPPPDIEVVVNNYLSNLKEKETGLDGKDGRSYRPIVSGQHREAVFLKFFYRSSARGNTNMEIYRRGKKIKERVEDLVQKKGDRPYLCDLVKEAIDCFLSIFVDENGMERQEVDVEEGCIYLRRLFRTTDRQDIVKLLEEDMPVAALVVAIQKAEHTRLDRIVNNKTMSDSTRKQYKNTTREETTMEKFDIKEHIQNSIADRGLSLKPVCIASTPNHDVGRIPLIDMSTSTTMEDLFSSVHHGSLSMTMHPEGHWDKDKYLQNKVTELNLLLVKKLVESGIEHGEYLKEAEQLTSFGNNFAIMYSYAIGLDQEWFVTDIVDRAWMAYCDTHM